MYFIICVMSHCTIHSFKIICCGWKAGLADHMMLSLYSTVIYGGLLVPFRLFVISQRNNATRKDEITPSEKTKRRNNAARKDEKTK